VSKNANKLMILTYHRVIEDNDWNDPDEVKVAQFKLHVDVLSRYFNVFTLSDGVRKLQERSLPGRAVTVTFDDGYRDNVSVALPILQARNVPATFFIASGFLNGGIMWNDVVIESVKRSPLHDVDLGYLDLGRKSLASNEEKRRVIAALLGKLKYLPQQQRDAATLDIMERFQSSTPDNLMMETADVLKLRDSGMEIGGHTRTHPILAAAADADAAAEIRLGKEDLEAMTGCEISSFAYPNGRPDQDYDLRHVDMVRQAGFVRAVTTASGCADGNSDVCQLGRMSLWHRSKPKLVLRMLLNYFSTPAAVSGGRGNRS